MENLKRSTEDEVLDDVEQNPDIYTSFTADNSVKPGAVRRRLILKCPFSVEQFGGKQILEPLEIKKIHTALTKLSNVTRPLFANAKFYLELNRNEANVAVGFNDDATDEGSSGQLDLDHDSPHELIARALQLLEKGKESEFGAEFGNQKLITKYRQLAHEIGANELIAAITDGKRQIVVEMPSLAKIPLNNECPEIKHRTEQGKITSICTNGFIIDHKTVIYLPTERQHKVTIGELVSVKTSAIPKTMRSIQLDSMDEITSSGQLNIFPAKE